MLERLDFSEFLRIMSCILIILLVVQGLDYLFGFGVNIQIFIVFTIVFAFTMGTLYYHIRTSDAKIARDTASVEEELDNLQKEVNMEYEVNGLTDEVLMKQVEINSRRNELDIADKYTVVNEEGFVQ